MRGEAENSGARAGRGDPGEVSHRGPLAWMAKNRVAANCLAAVLLLGGLLTIPTLRQEVFPEIQPELVIITVVYPGASPEEVENAIVLAVEEEVRGVDGVDTVRAMASEGFATIIADLFTGTDRNRAFNDIQAAVERIETFPDDVETPVIRLPVPRAEVISLILYGDFDRRTLNDLAELARSELLRQGNVTTIEISGLPAPEISIEVPHERLRRYNLSLAEVAERVTSASVDIPGGDIRAPTREVLVRTTEERDRGIDFQDILLLSLPDGTEVRIGDVATVVDGFSEGGEEAFFNGQPAVRLRIFRVGDQNPIKVSRAVREVAERWRSEMPDTVGIALWDDMSEVYSDRIGLLIEKGLIGLALVLLVLGTILHPRLAFWVSLGIAIAFLGGVLAMPALGVSINMISLFAFILVLGIVVDDAIVVGEAIHDRSQDGLEPIDACIAGVREVALPVTFAVSTSIIAFVPMLFVPGAFGDFFIVLPLIVIPILIVSLVEAFFVLPAHISLSKGIRQYEEANRVLRFLQRQQSKVASGLDRFIQNRYVPFAYNVIRLRYLTLACGLAILIIFGAIVAGGRIGFLFLPDIEGEVVTAMVEMPFGTPVEETREVVQILVERAQQALDGFEGGETGREIYSQIGTLALEGGGGDPLDDPGEAAGHLASVSILLQRADVRPFTAGAFSDAWRRTVGELPGPERLRFEHRVGPAADADVSVRLVHDDWQVLQQATSELASRMADFPGLRDIDDELEAGKEQINLRLRPEAHALGVTEQSLGLQVRSAFFGAEAQRQQRGREELRIFARLPRAERQSEYSLETLLIRTPGGGEIPLDLAAFIERGRSDTRIRREGGRRAVEVAANTDLAVTTPDEMQGRIEELVSTELAERFPGLQFERGGQQEAQEEAFGVLRWGLTLAVLVIYTLMAVIFRSYLQPLVVILAIPFGFAGAIAGHLLMGFELSLISILGFAALAGVVVNDSLVLVYAVNDFRRRGKDAVDAIVAGATRRFRPVLLTSLTAFLGLAPMIFETSVQARFLIPMALSLGFGVLLVTPIALILVPGLLMMLEDLNRLGERMRRRWESSGNR